LGTQEKSNSGSQSEHETALEKQQTGSELRLAEREPRARRFANRAQTGMMPPPESPVALMTRRIAARRSPIHGNGVFAVAPIRKGATVIQYKGRLITHAQADRFYDDGADTGHTFLFTLNDKYIVDANRDGNTARWINHSCAPNCEASIVEAADGNPRHDKVMIEALRDIAPGEELTYNYGIMLDVPHTARMKKLWACRCGAPHCTGTLLQPKK
jgi:SET domain-containing protein